MASFRSVIGVLQALQNHLEALMPASLPGIGANPGVKILSSQDLKNAPSGHTVGIYLHRISTDPFGRNRHLPPAREGERERPEIPVNLHILIIGLSTASLAEGTLVAWAMQQLAGGLPLGFGEVGGADPHWGTSDRVHVIPEEMSTEDLLRIWEGLPGDYYLSAPYLIKTLRLAPERSEPALPPVATLVYDMEDQKS